MDTDLLDADEARRLLAELTPAAEHTVLARALRTVIALHAVVDGRETPPTDAEIQAHAKTDGRWLVQSEYAVFISEDPPTDARDHRLKPPRSARWWALDATGKPCPWPVVTP